MICRHRDVFQLQLKLTNTGGSFSAILIRLQEWAFCAEAQGFSGVVSIRYTRWRRYLRCETAMRAASHESISCSIQPTARSPKAICLGNEPRVMAAYIDARFSPTRFMTSGKRRTRMGALGRFLPLRIGAGAINVAASLSGIGVIGL